MKMITIISFLLILLATVFGEVRLSLEIEDRSLDYLPKSGGEFDDSRLSSGSAAWQSYGYYTIYKTACVALGVSAVGFATGYSIGGIFADLLGNDAEANLQYAISNVILYGGIATAYGLSLFAPKIVAHNIHMDDPNANYDRLLESGLITEATCNALGIGLMILGYQLDHDFWTDALVIAGFLFYYVPTPTVMYSTYMNCDSRTPSPSANLNVRACTFSVTDLPDGSRDYSFKIDLANAIYYR